MHFTDTVGHQQLCILGRVLDDHCRKNHIDATSPEHEDARRLIILLYQRGWRTEDGLKEALAAAIAGEAQSSTPTFRRRSRRTRGRYPSSA